MFSIDFTFPGLSIILITIFLSLYVAASGNAHLRIAPVMEKGKKKGGISIVTAVPLTSV